MPVPGGKKSLALGVEFFVPRDVECGAVDLLSGRGGGHDNCDVVRIIRERLFVRGLAARVLYRALFISDQGVIRFFVFLLRELQLLLPAGDIFQEPAHPVVFQDL